jgi:glycosyltransferase involved in cell wall biosynthesis
MRICSPHCGVAPESGSGGETYERELLVRLGRAGVALDVILAQGKPHPTDAPNWTVHRFGIGRGLRWWVAPFIVPAAIARVHRATHFDVLRIHSLRYIGPSALWARRRFALDVPTVAHHHHLDLSRLNALIEKPVIEGCDAVVTVSEFSRRQLASELDVRVDHVSVIHNGIDERFAPGPRDGALAARLGLRAGPVVLFLGGLKPRKNLSFLLDLWPEVVARVPQATLVLAGDGPDAPALRRRARAMGIQHRIVFAGRVSEAEKPAVYRLADVFVSPSSLEGFGLSVGEAMSSRLPVIVARQGALPEIVGHGSGARVCDPHSVSDFVTAILEYLGSPQRRAIGGEDNRRRVDTLFRWDRAVTQVSQVYENALRRRRDRGAMTAAAWRS